MHLKVPADQRPSLIEKLETAGIHAASRGRSAIPLRLAKQDIIDNRTALEKLVRVAQDWSQR